jgi:mannose-6-phosphate isomerase-like protein (cupin superfamily)
MNHVSNIVKATDENSFFRRVVFTGAKSQLVVMSIPPGGNIGMEVHKHVEQSLFIRSGRGEASLDGDLMALEAGSVVVVEPGTEHDIRNTGDVDLKIFTVYAPPNHIDGIVHKTKAEADADEADEAFGQRVA